MQSENKQIIMLDTMVVGGIFALTKQGDHIEDNKKEWKKAVNSIVSTIKKIIVAVPPSVCFELMSWSPSWYEKVAVNSDNNPLFSYSGRPLKSEVLQLAAKYSHKCGVRYGEEDENKYKLKSMDPITAAYSIMHNYFILTENEKDFPESFFEIISIEKLVLRGKEGKKYRRFLFLLKPRN